MLHFAVSLILIPVLPLMAISLCSLIAIQIQKKHFDQPEIGPGERRLLQWPLWIWIPVIAVVGVEGWRIRQGDANGEQYQREQAAVLAQANEEFQKSIDLLFDKVRLGYVPHESEIENLYSYPETGRQVLIAALVKALGDDSEPLQKLALRICQPASNPEWARIGNMNWFDNSPAEDKARLLEGLRTYEETPDYPTDLRAEAKQAADWLESQISRP